MTTLTETIYTKPVHLRTLTQKHKSRGKFLNTQIISMKIGERTLTRFFYIQGNPNPVHSTETKYPIIKRRVINHKILN